ncbi:hypothetical protein COY13_01280 [Candidatus Roizmanbacteria bacterium CG_4_10_14_0_2_um_filter_36_35]|uniref:Phosphoribosyltransferase domain-containing protein n=5 Tax=Candidatus Roizmaniibacteriota TaxID=1752723 RepID=A0A2M8F446_9BACT|nr:MAG: hypothetical protein COX47_01775 [Candidatus Roizmanbacteria bacterium CG23_combo_of_CG06-09_8_20_14_all_35_49]PIP63149.1 MAG: hypothetical protein COW98_00150 [Candidatus Roizmanbacteria bacterium CG22_combo_CG10-13_8_21_14_all_35_9]PIY71330.1 MAG: hypothetical protein COY88_00965 [Candidatus Roizmanbacteria bacterium CG_4_10_14_0_8_um_filter_35_28]PIZ68416.1 MAG: hypothetical protein COY13_01280 [Candidatus Roizmanbacteria bacterium CG_4_10_14_0_2_um_filter_36_35]PJC34057.1 MAG: hypot
MKTNIRGRHILVVEDIIDTGLTIKKIDKHLRQKKPASLTTFALLEKPERRKVDFQVDYIGFKIPNVFVEGYGLDWDQFGRFNQDIFVGPVKPNHR